MTKETKHAPEPWYYEADDTPENGYDNLYLYTIKERTPLDAGEAKTHYIATRITYEKDARLIAAAPELLAYAECEEANGVSLLPSDKGGSGNGQSYMETFNKHGWDGRDVYGFLDKLRRAAIAKATSATPTGQAV